MNLFCFNLKWKLVNNVRLLLRRAFYFYSTNSNRLWTCLWIKMNWIEIRIYLSFQSPVSSVDSVEESNVLRVPMWHLPNVIHVQCPISSQVYIWGVVRARVDWVGSLPFMISLVRQWGTTRSTWKALIHERKSAAHFGRERRKPIQIFPFLHIFTLPVS